MAADTIIRPAPRSRGALRGGSGQGGFTLVELLVSLVILGFVMSLVSEAVFQVAQVTRAADATTRSLSARWSAGWTASSLFANLLAPDLGNQAPIMRGDLQRLEGYTSFPLNGGETGIAPFGLDLQVSPDGVLETQMLSSSSQRSGQDATQPAMVAVFPGKAEFAYVDRQGQVLSIWPPSTQSELDPEDLPKSVLVRDANSGDILMWYSFGGETSRQRQQVTPLGTLPP